jgi:hypothetical protein
MMFPEVELLGEDEAFQDWVQSQHPEIEGSSAKSRSN